MEQHDLLGYLLNLLDDESSQAVERELQQSSEARRKLTKLRRNLAPLGYDNEPPAPPANLVFNTLRKVAEAACRKEPSRNASRAIRKVGPGLSSGSSGVSGWTRWRRMDVLIAASIAFLGLLMAAPAILILRETQSRVACANNLRELYTGLSTWAADHSDKFPGPEPRGPLARAGVVMVRLNDGQLLGSPRQVNCPANKVRNPPHIPSAEELHHLFEKNRDSYHQLVRRMGGCYAYHLGFSNPETKNLEHVSFNCDKLTPILADRPPRSEEGPGWNVRNSPNHGGRGQNVLRVGGNVQFVTNRCLDRDDIYLNSRRRCRAGQGPNDNVLGCSETQPLSD
ncbi:MAG: hypothetical protein NZM31_12165 [Gemmatales bacterium]|nr:hypothetical protein [Gemmatales bacterium]MDW8387750.1 hypothetical protein [Gemmatales bacterium]